MLADVSVSVPLDVAVVVYPELNATDLIVPVDTIFAEFTVPVKVGDASGALASSAVVVGIVYPDAKEIAIVPDVVIGEFATESPVGTDTPTEVTVPDPPPALPHTPLA